ncbi:conserved hypothetical protein [Leishmania major strain Friedlin]|uniref:RING-type E3 ubiquitin transferase n=1 Tax=Leishmania major TaxID=5664 RepID=E9AD98_LEIMA|nr:conserved hypothetical protein [Leishmania major strain Friedlin]CAG9576724.1 RING-H2_zinc_finger/Anaphase-promoting_complex_subunit_11_RING-H2_finger/Ring_finger_domain_containing_protein_-_putative [Leishmania major strain Friedlin]CBZ12184.1 conserved hypothetical protein [Leishmania major strain Friedlin]|eukprot:XP_003721927.1 conserved hypothetical protein [Leishmania major strain Friedlin]
MLSTMDSRASPVCPSPSSKSYTTRRVCSPVVLSLVEDNLRESCSGETFGSSQPTSLTSSGGGPRTSALSPRRTGKSVLRAEERESPLTTYTPNSRPRRKSDTAVTLSSSASVQGSQEKGSNSKLRAVKLCKVSVPPQAPHTSTSLDTCTSPVQRSVSSQQARRSVSLTSSVLTSRPTEEFAASSTPSNPPLTSGSPAPSSLREHSVSISEEADECCICLEVYTNENPMFRGACQHHFHLPCLMEWKQRSSLCPMCCAETLRGIGDFEGSHHSGAADPAEVARQRAIAKRDAEIARNLQHSYLLQAQLRGRQYAYATQAVRSFQALHSGSPSSSTSRSPLHATEVEEHPLSTLPVYNRCNAQRLGGIVRQSPPLDNVRQPRATANVHSQLTAPPVHPSTEESRRSRSKPQAGCAVM